MAEEVSFLGVLGTSQDVHVATLDDDGDTHDDDKVRAGEESPAVHW